MSEQTLTANLQTDCKPRPFGALPIYCLNLLKPAPVAALLVESVLDPQFGMYDTHAEIEPEKPR